MITNEQLYDQNSIILAKLECLLSTVITRSNKIMATLDDLNAALAAATAATEAERTQVQDALAVQAASIQSLTDQIAALTTGGLVSQEQLDALVVAAQGISAAVEAIYVPA